MARLSIREWAEDDRPRERLMKQGPGALSDAELLAILIRTGGAGRSALDIAKSMLHGAGRDLDALSVLNVDELTRQKGMGPAKAITIMAALELGKRRRWRRANERKRITTSYEAAEQLRPHLMDLKHEEFWLLLLDRGNGVLGLARVSQGGMHGTVADPKLIFKAALDKQASGVILAHNHPSGRAVPSEEDLRLTKKLVEGGRLLDISVHDHIIIAGEEHYSFADHGTL
ncbi:MAG: DNA repair protein RadC [Flavobacteriales bacterium]|nr:DNA repair protein RadC [Flavobacteriales bacterium]